MGFWAIHDAAKSFRSQVMGMPRDVMAALEIDPRVGFPGSDGAYIPVLESETVWVSYDDETVDLSNGASDTGSIRDQ
jgi:hypothetical protein